MISLTLVEEPSSPFEDDGSFGGELGELVGGEVCAYDMCRDK